MSDTFLITGGTGFIGSNIVRKLVKDKKKVVILTSKDIGLSWRLKDILNKIEIHHCSLLDPNLKKIVKTINPTHIFHLASYGVNNFEKDEKLMHKINVEGTINLINALKTNKFKLFINAGSCFEYGIRNDLIKESDVANPASDYAKTKLISTKFCQKEAIKYSLPIINFRLFTPFGYYEDKNRLIPSVLLNILNKEPIKVGKKNNFRDFVFIDDVVSAYISCIGNKNIKPGEIYNVATSEEKSVEFIVNNLKKINFSSLSVEWEAAASKNYTESRWNASIAKIKKDFNWMPKHTLNKSLELTSDWFRKNLDLYS